MVEGNGLYIAFFGWYTVAKAAIESKNLPRLTEWVIKIAAFAVAMIAYGAVWVYLLQMPLPDVAPWLFPLAAVALCVVFAVYDQGPSGAIAMYHTRLRPKMRRWFRL